MKCLTCLLACPELGIIPDLYWDYSLKNTVLE